MHVLRRVVFRALSTTSSIPSTRIPGCISSTKSSFASLSIAKPSSAILSLRRGYATEDRRREEDNELEEDQQEGQQSAFDQVKDAVSGGLRSASEALGTATSATSMGGVASSAQTSPIRPEPGLPSRGEKGQTPSLYVGNLYFEVNDAMLKQEFEKFGKVTNVKIISDVRGLSKGFGYVEFEDMKAATDAKDALDGQVFEGRRLAVQFAVKKAGEGGRAMSAAIAGNGGTVNPPSKTLFIGNMSYEMSDKDLNDLFKQVKNVLDVRVAIDRRTGQPRGFAHADFIDVQSAEKAAEFLRTKEFYGRTLRIDYSANSSANIAGGK